MVFQAFLEVCGPLPRTDKIGSHSESVVGRVIEFEAAFDISIVPDDGIVVVTDFLRLRFQRMRPHRRRKQRVVFREEINFIRDRDFLDVAFLFPSPGVHRELDQIGDLVLIIRPYRG